MTYFPEEVREATRGEDEWRRECEQADYDEHAERERLERVGEVPLRPRVRVNERQEAA